MYSMCACVCMHKSIWKRDRVDWVLKKIEGTLKMVVHAKIYHTSRHALYYMQDIPYKVFDAHYFYYILKRYLFVLSAMKHNMP